MSALVVIAKECIPGRVKTRLHPPFSLEAAAAIAAASLAETLDAVREVPVRRRILYLQGRTVGIPHAGFEVIPQPDVSLAERLAAIFDLLDEPTLLIGMDTPQVRAADLRWPDRADAIVGIAADGGFWALGMSRPRGDVIRGVPMSQPDTGARQLAALARAGMSVELLRTLRDVDLADDARAVAAQLPGSGFARVVATASAESQVRA